MICFGVVQLTEHDIIEKFTSENMKSLYASKTKKIIEQATGRCPWRNIDVKYSFNYVQIDIFETMDFLFNLKGDVLKSEVKGEIIMNSVLSGFPECKLAFNTKSSIDNFKFHQCVHQPNTTENIIVFVPPDGEFMLGKYVVSKNIVPPFLFVNTMYDVFTNSRIEIFLPIRANYATTTTFSNISIEIPLPRNSCGCTMKCTSGKTIYDEINQKLTWIIKSLPGGKVVSLNASIDLIPLTKEKKIWKNEPIKLNFKIPYSTSAFKVSYLNIFEKRGYRVDKWIRYQAQSGEYHQRISK